jgi:threonine dehydrogenase-like Zn-dependent dehydrogenase
VILRGQERVEIEEFDVPEPGHGQVLIRMKASALCGSDLRAIYHEHKGSGRRGTRTSSPATNRRGRSRPSDPG